MYEIDPNFVKEFIKKIEPRLNDPNHREHAIEMVMSLINSLKMDIEVNEMMMWVEGYSSIQMK